jgi:hypothetical protein
LTSCAAAVTSFTGPRPISLFVSFSGWKQRAVAQLLLCSVFEQAKPKPPHTARGPLAHSPLPCTCVPHIQQLGTRRKQPGDCYLGHSSWPLFLFSDASSRTSTWSPLLRAPAVGTEVPTPQPRSPAHPLTATTTPSTLTHSFPSAHHHPTHAQMTPQRYDIWERRHG